MTLPLSKTIVAAYRGFGLLLIGRADAADCYDHSRRGLWLSFAASLAIMLPYILVPSPIDRDALRKHFVLLLAAWLPSLLVQSFVAAAFKATTGYRSYVIFFNWSQVVVLSIFTILELAFNAGFLPAVVLSWVGDINTAVILIFVFHAARLSLGISALGAICMGLADMAVSKILLAILGRMF